MKRLLFLILLTLLPAFTPGNVTATEEYAEVTGKSCRFCHLAPAGGGELTGRAVILSASYLTLGSP